MHAKVVFITSKKIFPRMTFIVKAFL